MKKKSKEKIAITLFLIITIIAKIWLIKVQPVRYLPTNKYDDGLMVNMANNLLQGKWLGEYNCLTLVKGIFTPLFIAITKIIEIPFLIGQDLFYDISCIFVIYVVGKILKNKKLLGIIYICLIFNPITYSAELCRVYRDGIYSGLTMFLIGFAYIIFLNRRENIKKQIKYFVGLGITLSSLYLCREETIWLLPFVLMSTIITMIFIAKDKNINNTKKRLLLYLIPIGIVIVNNLLVCTINYKNYGVFELNQYWSKEFKSAYGALTRIKPKETYSRVPVSQETMKRIYEISPKFKELEKYLSGEEGKRWSKCGDSQYGEIQGGWLHWALIRAVEEQGYYKDAKTANKYYQELADEINNAIDNGKIEGYQEKRVSIVPKFSYKEILETFIKSEKAIKYQTKYYLVNTEVQWSYKDDEKDVTMWQNVTTSKTDFVEKYTGKFDKLKLEILKNIKIIYEKVNPCLFIISIICLIVEVIYFIRNKKKNYKQILLILGLATLYYCRIFIITFTSITMYSTAMNSMYLANTYGIQILFSLCSIVFCINNINFKKILKGGINK